LFFGTREETYLAIYAAGVFVLLSMTGWAVTKRLVRQLRETFSSSQLLLIIGAVIAALLTSGATLVIFGERFFEGAWTYFLFIPALYAVFGFFRNRLGEPTPEMDYLGHLDSTRLAGFGFGQSAKPAIQEVLAPQPVEIAWQPAPKELSKWRQTHIDIRRVAVLLDGSSYAAQALPMAKKVCRAMEAEMYLLSSIKEVDNPEYPSLLEERNSYLEKTSVDLVDQGYRVNYSVRSGPIAEAANDLVKEQDVDLIITSTSGKSGTKHWQRGGVSRKLMGLLNVPVLLVQASEMDMPMPSLDRIVVSLDGSIYSERVLPYARVFARTFNSELVLISVPQVPEVSDYRAAAKVVETIRQKAYANMHKFLSAIARDLSEKNGQVDVRILVTGSRPSRTIVSVSEEEKADLIMLTSQGRGGLDLLMMGSVALDVVEETQLPVFMVPILD
jgi:nucleotide-binding universal stress UspA family protein